MMDINEESVVYEEIEVKEDFDHEILFVFNFDCFYLLIINIFYIKFKGNYRFFSLLSSLLY